jgi:glycosyltransferase involved in cell wall biosynthesis
MHKNNLTLFVQIPCLNEESTLSQTIHDIPKSIPGISEVKICVIDDGSTDNTIKVAEECGADLIVPLTTHKGLAKAFAAGLDACISAGADIIVNTDADNQYCGSDIPALIQPIIDMKAEIVIGIRNINKNKDFSFIKKKLQKIGSWVVRKLSGTKIKDVTSGFRAYSRAGAMRVNVMSSYSYTLETIIQAGRLGLAISEVQIRTNPKLRESRLFKNIFQYVYRSVSTIFKMYTIYSPLKVFFALGSLAFGCGIFLGLRFLYYFYILNQPAGKIQSLILVSILIILGSQLFIIGLLSNMISANRFLSENILARLKEKGQ